MLIIKYFISILLIVVLSIVLIGCHKTNVTPSISSGVKILQYEGHLGPYMNELPKDYKNLKPQIVKPNTRVIINFTDEPHELILKQWVNEKPIKVMKLKKDSFITPYKEGTYIYTIGAKWNIITHTTIVMVLKVKK